MAVSRAVALWPVGATPPYAYPASPACRDAGATPRTWPSAPLIEALSRQHQRDTWFQCVTGPSSRWPRIAKPILLDPRRVAWWELEVGVVGVDLDRPEHGRNPWRSREDAQLAVEEAAIVLDGSSVYATRGGLRAMWALDPPLPLVHAQSFYDQLHRDYLPQFDVPVSVDRGVTDWTRGYRAPWCPRADGKRAVWGDEAPPMDLTALVWGRTLDWRPEVLEEEDPRPAVTFDWSDRQPAAADLDGRIRELVARWCEEVAGASSRHEVLLRKTRALGGLCVGHGVSPEPYIPALVEAAGDSGDAMRTATDGLGHGAQEPWCLPRLSRVAREKRAYAGMRQ